MNDPLFGNKVAGAILAALLLFFGLPQLASRLFGEGHHGGEVAFAYPVNFEFGASPGGEVAAPVDLGTLLANANPKSGEQKAGICKSCHTFDKGGADSTGPNLWDVVGRPVAGHASFAAKYTTALKAFGGEWSYDRLDGFIANSQAFIPGTAMVQRFPKAEQRADILAYLHTLSDSPVAFPEPAPAPVAETEGAGAEGGAATETSPEGTTDAAPEVEQPTDNPVDTADDDEPQPEDQDATSPNPGE